MEHREIGRKGKHLTRENRIVIERGRAGSAREDD